VFASKRGDLLPAAARAELVALLAAEGARRDLAVVFQRGGACGLRLFATGGPAPDKAQAVTVADRGDLAGRRASVPRWAGAARTASGCPWEPAEHAYRPVNAAG